MKNTILIVSILTIVFMSCDKDENANPTYSTFQKVEGKWTIDSTLTMSTGYKKISISQTYSLEFRSTGFAIFNKNESIYSTSFSFLSDSTLLMDLNRDGRMDTTTVRVWTHQKRIDLFGPVNSGPPASQSIVTCFLSKP